MEETLTQSWRDVLSLTYEQILQQLIVFAPKLIGVVLLLLVGWVIALLLAKAARGGIYFLNRLLIKLFPNVFLRPESHVGIPYINIISKCVFWLVLLFFIAAAANSLGLNIVSQWMSQFILYLPRFAAGLLIIVGGYFAGSVIKMMAESTAQSAGFTQTELLGRSVQAAIFFTAIVIGIEQLGINIQFFTQFVIVIAAVIIFGFSLAFGLGARDLISNIVGVQQAQKTCRLGDHIKIAGVEGVLIEITRSTLILEADSGRVTVPAYLFLKEVGFIRTSSATKG